MSSLPTLSTSGLHERASVIDLFVGSSFMSPMTITLQFLSASMSESFIFFT